MLISRTKCDLLLKGNKLEESLYFVVISLLNNILQLFRNNIEDIFK